MSSVSSQTLKLTKCLSFIRLRASLPVFQTLADLAMPSMNPNQFTVAHRLWCVSRLPYSLRRANCETIEVSKRLDQWQSVSLLFLLSFLELTRSFLCALSVSTDTT